MTTTYFIDSENVGDIWTSLLPAVTAEDDLLVFYTLNSPHMNYRNLRLLKESPIEVEFIECCEGSNALDFQLCTELGYRINSIEGKEYVIVTNDNGYDAVVKYWRKRGQNVRRIHGKACLAIAANKAEAAELSEASAPSETTAAEEPSLPETAVAAEMTSAVVSSSVKEAAAADTEELSAGITKTAAEAGTETDAIQPEAAVKSEAKDKAPLNAAETASEASPEKGRKSKTVPEKKTAEKTSKKSAEKAAGKGAAVQTAGVIDSGSGSAAGIEAETDHGNGETGSAGIDDTAKELLFLVGKDNLQQFHEALQQIFGTKKATAIYNAMKKDTSCRTYLEAHAKMSSEEKQTSYCSIVFSQSDGKEPMPADFPAFALMTWREKKNLNSFRSSLQQKYGKEKSEKYYSIFKAHIKILDTIN